MSDFALVVLWLGLTLYAVLAGGDFGVGIWHLLATGRDRGRQRALIERSIGPVWEANHVWLIFSITLFWIAFPAAFGAFAATLYLPLALVALGVTGRGAAFAFRKPDPRFPLYRLVYGVSSVLTPFVLGMVAGALAAGRVPPVVGAGDAIGSWINPTSVYCGVLAVGSCAYLAAAYLTADAVRGGDRVLAEAFRRRALGAAVAIGLAALVGLPALRADAPGLVQGMAGRGMPITTASILGGLASLVLVAARRYRYARVAAAGTVATLLWGWGAAQYPVLLHPGLTVARPSNTPTVLSAVLAALAVSALVLAPAVGWLFVIFQRDPRPRPEATRTRGSAHRAKHW
jgi:cytochrome d ubiquinol oxidase subunit II